MSQAEVSHSIGEKLRWWLAIAAVIGGVVANLYYEDELATVLRVLILFGGLLLGALIAATTTKGKNFFAFVRSVIGLFLSLVDFFFSWSVGYFFG